MGDLGGGSQWTTINSSIQFRPRRSSQRCTKYTSDDGNTEKKTHNLWIYENRPVAPENKSQRPLVRVCLFLFCLALLSLPLHGLRTEQKPKTTPSIVEFLINKKKFQIRFFFWKMFHKIETFVWLYFSFVSYTISIRNRLVLAECTWMKESRGGRPRRPWRQASIGLDVVDFPSRNWRKEKKKSPDLNKGRCLVAGRCVIHSLYICAQIRQWTDNAKRKKKQNRKWRAAMTVPVSSWTSC